MSTHHTEQQGGTGLAPCDRATIGRNHFRITLCLCRRLNLAQQRAEREWAKIKRNLTDTDGLSGYVRTLRRCDTLKSQLERRVA